MPPALHEFRLLPRFTGVWDGEFVCLDDSGREIKRYRSLITQLIVDGGWVQTNENTYPDGTSDTWHFFGHATADGEMLLESPDPPYSGFRMTVREVADHVLLLLVNDAATGLALATETFTLIDDRTRVRTIQQFAPPDGRLRGFMVIKERRMAPAAQDQVR